MSATGYSTFDKTLDKTNLVLKQIEHSYGWPKERRNQSYDAMRSVLHALRDRLTVNECADMAAQLPLLIRGVFYEDWHPSRVPVKMNKEEFLQNIRNAFPYEIEGSMERLVSTVLQALRQYVTEGEWRDIKSSISQDLRPLIPA